jgi:hypothetical protein
MPHDANGNVLQVGDEVIVRCKVAEVMIGDEYCNVTLRTLEPMPPYIDGTCVTLNTRQTEKVPAQPPDHTPATREQVRTDG